MEAQISAFQKLVNTVIEFLVNYSFQVLGAVIVLTVGFLIARWVSGLVLKIAAARKLDISLSRFLAGIVKVLILAFAVIIALGKFGITIAPFIAALGAAAFGATYAIQGPLSNYGAGIAIILGRPFVVGNTITVGDVSGVVDEVSLSTTILSTEDGVRINIPNKDIVGQILYNSGNFQMAEGVVGISYGSEPETAIRVIRESLAKFDAIAKVPAPQVGIRDFGDSSVNLAYRYWVPTKQRVHISHAVNLEVFKALGKAEIQIPFPQRDVRIVSAPASAPSSPKVF
jgi:small conductance mechanosensitive channel